MTRQTELIKQTKKTYTDMSSERKKKRKAKKSEMKYIVRKREKKKQHRETKTKNRSLSLLDDTTLDERTMVDFGNFLGGEVRDGGWGGEVMKRGEVRKKG